jgi:hypothetical protein
MSNLRDIAQGIADFIMEDEYLHDSGHVTAIVEDKASLSFEIPNAISQLGVCVVVAVTGFDVVQNSPVLQGTVRIQVSCYEHPELNREDESSLTAQGAMERIARILHYCKLPCLPNQLICKGFSRDDVDEANIVRGNFETNTIIGLTA